MGKPWIVELLKYLNPRVENSKQTTHIEKVARHVAAVALLVPVGPLVAGLVQVAGQAAVVAVPVGTLVGQVAWSATEEAGHHLLLKHTHTHKHGRVSSFSHPCRSAYELCSQSDTDFGLGAVLGEVSGLVAVPALDGLVGVVSVCHARQGRPGSLLFVVNLSLKHTHSK